VEDADVGLHGPVSRRVALAAQREVAQHLVLAGGLGEVEVLGLVVGLGGAAAGADLLRRAADAEAAGQAVAAAGLEQRRVGDGDAPFEPLGAVVRGRVEVQRHVELEDARLLLDAQLRGRRLLGRALGDGGRRLLVERARQDYLLALGKGGLEEDVVAGHDGVVVGVVARGAGGRRGDEGHCLRAIGGSVCWPRVGKMGQPRCKPSWASGTAIRCICSVDFEVLQDVQGELRSFNELRGARGAQRVFIG